MPASNLRLLDADMTSSALPFAGLVDAVHAGFARGCIVPVCHHHHTECKDEPEATVLLLPAWSNPEDWDQYLGAKLETLVPRNAGRGIPGLTSTYVL